MRRKSPFTDMFAFRFVWLDRARYTKNIQTIVIETLKSLYHSEMPTPDEINSVFIDDFLSEMKDFQYVFVAGYRLATMITDEAVYLADGLETGR